MFVSASFLSHFEEIRRRLFYSFMGVLITFIISWFFRKQLYEILTLPAVKFLPEGENLVFTALTAPFMTYLNVSLVSALFLSSPFIFFQIWQFISPALYRRERRTVILFVSLSTLFFISGALFGYFIVFPIICRFFLHLGRDFRPILTINDFFSLALRILIGIAIAFETPTLIFLLSRLGIVTHKWLAKNFKYAVIVGFVIAAVITPTPDMFTQCIVAFPMIILYGLSILIAYIFSRRKSE